VALASRYAVPAIYYLRSFAEADSLISYADSNLPAFHEAGISRLNGDFPAAAQAESVPAAGSCLERQNRKRKT